MKNKDIIRAIKKEANSFIPDMKSQIMSSLPFSQEDKPIREKPRFYKRPVFAIAAIVLCLSAALLLTYFLYNPQTDVAISNSYISIDINPSIELTADKNDIVTSIRPMNADAAILIFEENFSEMSVEDACVKIVSLAVEAEYIDANSENAINIIGINDNQKHETALSNKIRNKLQNYLTENSISANLNTSTNPSKELKEAAKQHKVTVGKMELLNQLLEKYPEITFEEAKKKSVKEINELLKNYDEEAITNLASTLEDEYAKARQNIHNELQREISEIENNYADILGAINNVIALSENQNGFPAFQNSVITFNEDFPAHKYNGIIAISKRQEIKSHFENLLEQMQTTMNQEKQEKQENVATDTRQQIKNKWKNHYNTD